METAVFLAVLALFGTIVAGLFKLIGDGQKAQITLSDALNKVASTNKEIAEATKKGAREAETRNGHLAEITTQSKDQILTAISTIGEQHVLKQTVDKQTIKE